MNGNSSSIQNKYFLYIAAFYITIKLTAFLMTHKVTEFHGVSACFAVLIIPLWFLTGNIIAEVYGYRTAKQLIWMSIACQIIMTLICYVGSKTISPYKFLPQSLAYKQIFGTLPIGVITNSIAIVCGGLTNAYIIILLKKFLNGKYFALRCFIANAIGECIFTIIAYSAGIFESISIIILAKLILASYTAKLIITPLLVLPTSIIANMLKNLELSTHNTNSGSGILKHSIKNKDYILHIKEDNSGRAYFGKYRIQMPIEHELGKLSEDYNNIKLRFGEFKEGVCFGSRIPQNPLFLICLSGKIKITLNDNTDVKYLNSGNIILFDDIKGNSHTIEIISDAKLIIINLI